METVVRKSQIPNDCGILIEYNIPSTSKRIDFVITGHNENNDSNFLIIELKQWESAEATNKEAIVKTFLNNSIVETTHPAYQAYSYKKFLSDMNAEVYEGRIKAISCAYLHNYKKKNPEPLLQEQYKEIVSDTPVFFSSDVEFLEEYVNEHVGRGDGLTILDNVENSKLIPSKKFINYIDSIFKGNKVFTLLDEQKLAYSSIVDIALNSQEKTAIIINGGPGTGKSVVAVNAFVALLKHELNVRFVAPNASFRDCIIDMLGKKKTAAKNRIKNLFLGSSKFYGEKKNYYDVLICDEAHRLKKKGAYMYQGVSQVEDIINASRVSIFFVDDEQMIRPDDEGSVERIKKVCSDYTVSVYEVQLVAQFRCSGADGYINWLDHTLQIKDTANYDGWDDGDFEFALFDDPHELYNKIHKLNENGMNARVLAGFAWPWTLDGNDDAQIDDVVIPECKFQKPWNSRKNQQTWATDPQKIDQIGCIHTSQGLEFDYVGVIIGNDLRFNVKNHTIYASEKDYFDKTGKKGLKNNPDALTMYVKRIYKVLMSRGVKGCYVYCRDENLRNYLKDRAPKAKQQP